MSDPAALEAALCRAYEEQADLYASALPLAEEVARAHQHGEGADAMMMEMMALLDQVRAVEDRIARWKAGWQASGHKPGPEFQAVLARTTGLIERLASHVQAAEGEALAQKGRLAPQLDAAALGQRMQQAYGGAMAALRREAP